MEIQNSFSGKHRNKWSWKRRVQESTYCTFFITNQFFERVELIERVLYAKNLQKPMIVVFKYDTNDLIRKVFGNANVIGEIESDSISSKKDKERILTKVQHLIDNFIRRTKRLNKI